MICAVLSLTSCYIGFKGISIQADVNTFLVEDFISTNPRNAQDIQTLFAEAIREKIRNESKLVKTDDEPDVIFRGNITDTKTSSLAPEDGNTASLNRLEIFVKVEYTNNKYEDDSWSKNYSAFRDFDRNQDFTAIQSDLTEAIINEITERVFNDAFTTW